MKYLNPCMGGSKDDGEPDPDPKDEDTTGD